MTLTVSYTVPESVVRDHAQFIFDELDYEYGGDAIHIANLDQKEFVEGLANYPKFREELVRSFRELGEDKTLEVFDRQEFVYAVNQFPAMKYIASLLKDASEMLNAADEPELDEFEEAITAARKVLKKAGYRVVKS